MPHLSPLAALRSSVPVALPSALQNLGKVAAELKEIVPTNIDSVETLVRLFPKTIEQPILYFKETLFDQQTVTRPLRLAVVLSGGQAPGGHNVIAGLFDALEKLHSESVLFGFLNGPSGILSNQYVEITKNRLATFRNQGGFDLLGSGRTKISTPEQFALAKRHVEALSLDGLVIVGGDDSNTNAALLAEYFLAEGCAVKVVGVPKTIDGDLKNSDIEISFGFDTATKCYAETIGNIAKDAISAKKYYYFIKVMGRSASHIALECALQNHPNMTLISEEVAAQRLSLKDIIDSICDMVAVRSSAGRDYGIIIIPEGLIEFIPEMNNLISELNLALAQGDAESVITRLSPGSRKLLEELPEGIQKQLLLDRDPHGNVQVSKIETEKLLITLVEEELNKRHQSGNFFGKFLAQPHFCGYEGRSCLPSYFDSHYCYALGHVAALLIAHGFTGYMCALKGLHKPLETWQPIGVPITNMFTLEKRKGKMQPVVTKALVELDKEPFQTFKQYRDIWLLEDDYLYPGPVQFFGPKEIVEAITNTLQLEVTSKNEE
jgi:pyrophosphate--fructose-6-phosphate 1-phosphotransferase